MSHTCHRHNGDPAYCDACREEHEERSQRLRDEERGYEDYQALTLAESLNQLQGMRCAYCGKPGGLLCDEHMPS